MLRHTIFVLLALALVGPAAPVLAQTCPQNGLQFDGATSIDAGSGTWYELGSITIEFWIRPDANNLYDGVIGPLWHSGPDQAGVGFQMAGSGEILFLVANPTFDLTLTAPVPTGLWSHVAGTYDGSLATLYVNGLEVGKRVGAGPINYVPHNSFHIGRFVDDDESTNLTGVLDEIRVWDHARSAAQISGNYGLSMSGSEPGLVLHYKLNESAGATVSDSSSPAHDGVTGAQWVETCNECVGGQGCVPMEEGTDPNDCDQAGDYPDVIVGDIYQTTRYNAVGDISAFSIGTISCNFGTCWLDWIRETNQHPVIAQNMFRLKDGRFEQVGQSWLKHGVFALSEDYCSLDCLPTDGNHLGVNCSDPYTASFNGQQNRLGPKFEINASTGEFPYPATNQNNTGNSIYKRLQVHNDDLDPALNPAALYFVEGQYVHPDDAAVGLNTNNASWRPVDVQEIATEYDISLTGSTQTGEPAVHAWSANDATVVQSIVDVAGDGRFIVAAKTTDLGGGQWRYEYAVQNTTSHRSARRFAVPWLAGGTVGGIGFHDVDYHSGEPFDGTDWPGGVSGSFVEWQTDDFATNQNANALRWGTLYNFRFDSDRAPDFGDAVLGLFRPGSPSEATATTIVPALGALCDARTELFMHTDVRFSWSTAVPGSDTTFDVVRGDLGTLRSTGGDFQQATQDCLADDETGTLLVDGDPLNPGQGYWYLIRRVTGSEGDCTYDTGSASQSVSRDPGITAAATTCP